MIFFQVPAGILKDLKLNEQYVGEMIDAMVNYNGRFVPRRPDGGPFSIVMYCDGYPQRPGRTFSRG